MKNKPTAGKRHINHIRPSEMNKACDRFMKERGLTRTDEETKNAQRPYGSTKVTRSDIEWQYIDPS